MKISVIIPTYNISNELSYCMESLDRQSLSKDLFEIIIIDDCSTDNTFDVARHYSEKNDNIRCYQLTRNGGPGIARNKGIDEAEGDFIFFLDGDDILPSDSLESLENIAFKHQADVVTFNWAYTDVASRPALMIPMRKDLFAIPSDKRELIKLYLLF